MSYHGDYRAADVIDFKFSTVSTAGVPTTLSGSPVLSIYKSNSTTESTTGITLTVDFDSRTGMNHVHITTASDGTFYADANDFDVVITTGTVSSVSVVGIIVGSFSISNRSALRPTTVGRTLVVDAAGLADANTVKVGATGAGTAQTARDLGLALPAAAPQAAGGLITSTAGSFDIDEMNVDVEAIQVSTAGLTYTVSNQVDANVLKIAGTTQTAADVGSLTTEINADADEIITTLGVAGAGLTGLPAIRTTYNIVKNVALLAFPFVMTDSTTGAPKTGLTITATRCLNGGAFGAMTNSAVEVANGLYTIDLAAADTNANTIAYRFTSAGANDIILCLVTQT